MMDSKWLRRRWHDFRLGHSTYLIFAMTFSNFVLIFYRLLIEKVQFLGEIFNDLWLFVIVFGSIYVPMAIIIGAWHRRTQYKVENEQIMLNNPFMARNFRILIDILEGRAKKEEVQNFRDFLFKIEKKSDLFFDEKENNKEEK